MAFTLLGLTFAAIAVAMCFGWICSVLAGRLGIERSSGFSFGLVLGVAGVAVVAVRGRLPRRSANPFEETLQ